MPGVEWRQLGKTKKIDGVVVPIDVVRGGRVIAIANSNRVTTVRECKGVNSFV